MRPFIAIFLFTWFLNLFLGWWAVLIPSIFFGAWLIERGFPALYIGLFAGGAAWFVQALYIHLANDGILSTRIAEILQVGSPWIVLLITFFIGGILSALGALFGFQLKNTLHSPSTTT
jgi:hypothetical protein